MSVSKADLPFDFDDVYGEDCPIREENFKLDNESAKDKPQAGMARVRLLTDFIFVKGKELVFPIYDECTAEFWEGVEVYGFMLMPGTNGDGRWFAWTLLWQLDWPDKHFELVRIKNVLGISLERSEHYRNGHELALFLNTAGNYSYALMEPEDTIRERWLHVLASWSKAQVTKKNRKPEPIPLPQPPLQFGIPPTWWLKKNGKPGNEAVWQRFVKAYNAANEKLEQSDLEPEPEPSSKSKNKSPPERREKDLASDRSVKGKGKGKVGASSDAKAEGKGKEARRKRRSGTKSSSSKRRRSEGSSSNESLSEPHGNSEAEEETAQAPEASVISVPVSLAVPQRTSRPQRKPKPAYVEIDPPAPTPVVTQAGAEGSSSAKPSLGTDARPEPAPKRQKVMRIEHLAPPKLSSGSIALEGQEAKARMQAEADSGRPCSLNVLSASPTLAGLRSKTTVEHPTPTRPDMHSSDDRDGEGSVDVSMLDVLPVAGEDAESQASSAALSQGGGLAGAVRQLSIVPGEADGPHGETAGLVAASSSQTETGDLGGDTSSYNIMTDPMFPLTQPRRRLSSTPDSLEEASDAERNKGLAAAQSGYDADQAAAGGEKLPQTLSSMPLVSQAAPPSGRSIGISSGGQLSGSSVEVDHLSTAPLSADTSETCLPAQRADIETSNRLDQATIGGLNLATELPTHSDVNQRLDG
ncbi:hypothetical protein RhiJN_08789 [Ceratobasidium sp. AG-Ba]|nr:hypothetical protein RhiJN_08789 [Ceratobasidium sp. AG-Ba]QRW09535.1 hypothetical protein RhiLY_08534 [Ceratobasidium sp. AG-Ba]QRW11074.1 hypothetical protein RhiLY_10073 [Ceratobasidium sp. AG-Ba]QRW11742.1 hypothetical protein RhiLY_10741 [Ceratobasidium sp. AG-Ba]QRW13071.1 hypothetical protein RhiLY_12070 [Ceratobasidium sp. AG-Ba]